VSGGSDAHELIAAAQPEFDALAAALGPDLALRTAEPVTFERVHLDTFDGLLYADGLTLRWERGRFELLGAGEELPRLTATGREPRGPLLGTALPAGPLREAVLSVIDVRALLPRARLRVSVQPVAILDELDKTVARIQVEVPELELGGGRRPRLRTRVRLLEVRGYEGEIARVRKLASKTLALEPAAESMFAEAVTAAGERPEGVSAKVEVAISPADRTDAAAVAVLGALLGVIDANLPGTLADVDPEFLHDYRVSVRRTRSVQRELKGAFPPAELERMRGEFKWLQQVTGDARDLDVYVLGFDSMRALVPASMRDDLAPLLTLLQARRSAAHRRMRRDLRSDRAAALRSEWGELLGSLVDTSDADRADAARPIGEVASERIRNVYGRMVRMGGAIDAGSPPEDYHELRKKGKELRYLLELFGAPLYPGDVVKPMIKSLKSLQDVLGRHQDREVQVALLRSLGPEVAETEGPAEGLMALGALIGRLADDERAARGEFAGRFAEFASKEQRRLVKETFE